MTLGVSFGGERQFDFDVLLSLRVDESLESLGKTERRAGGGGVCMVYVGGGGGEEGALLWCFFFLVFAHRCKVRVPYVVVLVLCPCTIRFCGVLPQKRCSVICCSSDLEGPFPSFSLDTHVYAADGRVPWHAA